MHSDNSYIILAVKIAKWRFG